MADNKAWPHKRVPPEIIGTALTLFFEGLSLNNVSRLIWQRYHIAPTKSTLHRWTMLYAKVAEKVASELKPIVCGTMVVDETELKVGDQYAHVLDVIDAETRFLVASRLTISRTLQDVLSVIKQTQNRVVGIPEFVISSKLAACFFGTKSGPNTDTWHINFKGLRVRLNNDLVEKFHETLKPRARIIRGLRSMETARSVLSGYLVYYNFLRPDGALGMKTPAQAAGIKFPYATWESWVNRADINNGSC